MAEWMASGRDVECTPAVRYCQVYLAAQALTQIIPPLPRIRDVFLRRLAGRDGGSLQRAIQLCPVSSAAVTTEHLRLFGESPPSISERFPDSRGAEERAQVCGRRCVSHCTGGRLYPHRWNCTTLGVKIAQVEIKMRSE